MKYWIVLFTTFLILNNSFSQSVDRLFRFPAVHNDQLVFCYAGDLYLVDANGGTARRLTSDVGFEMFPKFSHDGKTIAFTAQYDGNTEVYTMPTAGGTPKRITYTATLNRDDISDRMGPNNIVMDWSVDDQSILYRSRRYTFNSFKGILLKAPVNGGMSEQLPFDVAGWCSYNYDGTKLAYNRVFREFRTWKYYEGGMADDIWIYDTKTESTENITRNDAQDIMPMFYKDKVYFISDRDRIMNIFSYDLNTKSLKKVTNFDLYDVKFPSLSKDKITFENGGHIYILNPENEELNKVDIKIKNDLPYSRKREVLA
ncbi:MAG: hypothetical protein MRY83_19410, partial [Flavobacteriales bacterium]|nr:hypothetical protein [Flavobacteriales bacterium]